jgi:hypothetical protein
MALTKSSVCCFPVSRQLLKLDAYTLCVHRTWHISLDLEMLRLVQLYISTA